MRARLSDPRRNTLSGHSPAIAEGIAQITIPAQRIKIRAPAGCTKNARTASPRTIREKEVVIPQNGQGIWNRLSIRQGASPSCSCVPNPRSSGLSQRASRKTSAIVAATSSARIRCRRSRRRIEAVEGFITESTRLKSGPRHVLQHAGRLQRSIEKSSGTCRNFASASSLGR